MKRFLKTSFIIITLFAAAMIAIITVSLRWLKVDEHTVYFDDLPNHLEGLRILHISDLHSDSQSRMNIDIWKHIDNLNFDIAVITGDIISDAIHLRSDPTSALNPHKEGLKALAQKVPTFFVEGNHESRYYYLFEPIMRELGITPLKNEKYSLEINANNSASGHNETLQVIGTADYSLMRRTNNFSTLDNLFNEETPPFRLVLTHQPQIFDRFKGNGPMFVLSGHTHGGQIRIPFLPTLYAPGQGIFPKYGSGLYFHNEAIMYVSRGAGATYNFPVRFWNRPIITVLELQAESKD